MTLDEYQEKAQATAAYPPVGGHMWVYPALGLAGEAGEIANKLKKVIRDTGGRISPKTQEAIKDELGDVLWYVSQLARELDLGLEEIAQANIAKLSSRRTRDKISGSGDTR